MKGNVEIDSLGAVLKSIIHNHFLNELKCQKTLKLNMIKKKFADKNESNIEIIVSSLKNNPK